MVDTPPYKRPEGLYRLSYRHPKKGARSFEVHPHTARDWRDKMLAMEGATDVVLERRDGPKGNWIEVED